MEQVRLLRERAAEYRRQAEAASDRDVALSYLLLAELDEQEAAQLERDQRQR